MTRTPAAGALAGPGPAGPRADPLTVATWVRGWTIARGVAPPLWADGAWRVEVGLPTQRARFVFPALTEAVRRRAEAVTEPWVFLKICAPDHAVRPLLPPGWVIQQPGFMMVCGFPMRPGTAGLPPGYSLAIARDAAGIHALITAPGGETAASGTAVRVRGHAIYDRIVTQPEHRRRGLGRAIMHALEGAARAHGLHEAVLVATPEGRALYESLGWRLHAPYTTAVILG
jgi:hypothetical protein